MCAMAGVAGLPGQAHACNLETIGTATFKTAVDGRTVTLADGREIRLAAIETPTDETRGTAARGAIESLLAGREISLKRLGSDSDRHGRVAAFAYLGNDARSVQAALLAAGHARVAAWVGDRDCALELLRSEQQARQGRLGIWADPHYVIRRSEHPAEVLAERGRFALVEGQVLSVRESGGTIYMNFGRRWSEDFTVTIPKRLERTFTAAGLELKNLSGRRVRVRGVVEERGGPWIEAVRPEQIEIATGS
jgi:endonuclease YncB( thermonuclease family)